MEFRRSWEDSDLTAFRNTVARFVDKEIAPDELAARERGHVRPELWRQLGKASLLCTDIPESYGGHGGDYRHDAIIQEELARRGVTSLGIQGHSITAHYVLNHGTEAQKRKYLPLMASGEVVGAIAMSEPGTGSDLKAIRTRAEKRGGNYILNGSKVFISNGMLAGLIVVVCKTAPDAGTRGISLIIVEPRQCPGFRFGKLMDKMLWKGQDTSEFSLEDAMVPSESLLGGAEGRGFAQLMHDLGYERLGVAVTALAAMEGALQQTVEYVRDRLTFGRPVFDYQNTKFKLADVATQIAVGRAFVDRCIEELVQGKLDPTTAAMVKLWASEAQGRVMDECLQFFGGYGLMNEYLISRLYVDARGQRIWAGTNEIMRDIIARAL